MTKRTRTWIIIVALAIALEGWALYVVGLSPERWRPAMVVKDEPAARAVYEAMVQTIRSADSLSYHSACGDPDGRTSFYKIRLAKPGLFRIELLNFPSLKGATLVGDGNDVRVIWSGNRQYLWCDDQDSYDKTRSNVYVKRAMRAGNDSIAGQIAGLGIAWHGCILDPSILHGHTDILDPYMDGICSRGTNKVGGEKCDVIEISYMNAQRSRHLWIARRDHLPRRIKEIVRVADNKVTSEEWSDIRVNDAVSQDTFVWSPPADYQSWSMPHPEDMLVKSGQEAPDFELFASDGGKIKLSDYRGNVVWLYLWQCGSPECRQEWPHLQGLYEKHKDGGLVVLGLNIVDDNRVLRAFLRENPVTFPMIHDGSATARGVVVTGYGNKRSMTPMSCIIDREGRIVDRWLRYEGNPTRARAALEKAGLSLATDN